LILDQVDVLLRRPAGQLGLVVPEAYPLRAAPALLRAFETLPFRCRSQRVRDVPLCGAFPARQIRVTEAEGSRERGSS